MSEYISYFERTDLPTNMWAWIPFKDAKAISGFSVVPKKDGTTQRKLLMSCSFNYLLTPVVWGWMPGGTSIGSTLKDHRCLLQLVTSRIPSLVLQFRIGFFLIRQFHLSSRLWCGIFFLRKSGLQSPDMIWCVPFT